MNFRVHRLTANFGTAEISLLHGTTAIRGAVEQRTSVYAAQRQGDVSKVGYFFDIPASLKLSLYTIMT